MSPHEHIDHCWTVACHQHFDGRVQVIARVRRPSHAINKTLPCQPSVNLVYAEIGDVIPKTNCPKNRFDSHLETPKDNATKRGRNHVWDRALRPSCKISRRSVAWSPRYLKTSKLQHIWPFGGTTDGTRGLPHTFQKALFTDNICLSDSVPILNS